MGQEIRAAREQWERENGFISDGNGLEAVAQGPEPDMQNQLTLTLAAEGEGNRLFEAV